MSEVEELRKAVKQEAGTLRKQLHQLVHLSDGTFRRVDVRKLHLPSALLLFSDQPSSLSVEDAAIVGRAVSALLSARTLWTCSRFLRPAGGSFIEGSSDWPWTCGHVDWNPGWLVGWLVR